MFKILAFLILIVAVSCTPTQVTPTPTYAVTSIPPTIQPSPTPSDDIIRQYHPDRSRHSNNALVNWCSSKAITVTLRAYEYVEDFDPYVYVICIANGRIQ